jgi:hypothetical protein
MATNPVFLSPALPAELLTFIINQTSHPTTLIICMTRTEFLQSLLQDVPGKELTTEQNHDLPPTSDTKQSPKTSNTSNFPQLVSAPLFQTAIARHIRLVFIPTVTHLRAFMSVFPATDTKVAAPPEDTLTTRTGTNRRPPHPLLLVYGFLALHRDTSEWSAQGLSNTAAALVEVARENGFRAVIVEPRADRMEGEGTEMEALLGAGLPVITGAMRRANGDGEEGGWTGRKVDVRRVLGRWFGFEGGHWDLWQKLEAQGC